MAIQVTIKVTKTDNTPWVFTYTEPSSVIQGMEQAKAWLCREWNLPSNNEAVLIKTFENMIDANKFIIRQIDTDFPEYESVNALFSAYENKNEQITTQEV
jgi:hypothetical protein